MSEKITIGYAFSNCSNRLYQELFENSKKFVLVTDQKYHGLLMRGLIANNVSVSAFSGLPINKDVTKKILIKYKDDTEDNIEYHYYMSINRPIFRSISLLVGGFINIIKKRKELDCIVCDMMSTSNALGVALAGRLCRIPIIVLVMDLPGLMETDGKPLVGVHKEIANFANGFILLTEQMSSVVNPHHKPYIVMEGHVDYSLPPIPKYEKWENTTGKKIIIYAGGIHKIFGIQMLVQAFIDAKIHDSELRIFGDGDYKEELLKISQQYPNIKYMGVCSNNEVVFQEQRAALLVNPRPSLPTYTKYSFPSKNMEYMMAGTPVLTTNLPGMPKEYLSFVYLIEDESVNGISVALKKILSLPFDEREKLAEKARDYVNKNKTNIIQARRIKEFINNELLG